ncbi:hypothetical protein JCM3770_005605 [Rhodotorula araucariae]
MSTLDQLFPPGRRVVLLDGGMGTTLQAPPFELPLDSALWSSELLATADGRAHLDRLHRTWIDAGADVVETCTYQSSLPLFLPASGSPSPADVSAALTTMTAALPVAIAACANSPAASHARVALSLGPYGAALQPGQEYTGAYPPPFGPAATAVRDTRPAGSDRARAVAPLPLDAVRRAGAATSTDEVEAHLAAWHLQRLAQFAQSDAWRDVAIVAFETVPSLAEIRAIRRAVHVFRSDPAAPTPPKPFYISLVLPRSMPVGTETKEDDVRFPDPALAHLDSLDAQLALLAVALLGGEDGLAVPAALGFNCTSPLAALGVVRALSAAVTAHSPACPDTTLPRPWLVLYPDGGAVYDVRTRTWSHPAGLTDATWAAHVADAVDTALESAVWGGVLAGGCCKAGPGAIRALADECRRRGWRE